jgi:hypothetical protein
VYAQWLNNEDELQSAIGKLLCLCSSTLKETAPVCCAPCAWSYAVGQWCGVAGWCACARRCKNPRPDDVFIKFE